MLNAQTRIRAGRLPTALIAIRSHARSLSTIAPLPRKPKWGLFSDLHFQPDDLPRIIATSNWILDTFRANGVSQIICLGDVINTREHVHVQALSSAIRFFDELASIAPVHIVLGNHDMNLKHSARVSSLDVFSIEALRSGWSLYREWEQREIEGYPCLMVPWVENHSEVVQKLVEMDDMMKGRSLLFGHLAVSGAIQQPSVPVTSRYRCYSGVLKGRYLSGFRGAYLGHFHHHQELGGDSGDGAGGGVWYVGAPMQHHFGDKSDERRGVMIVEPGEETAAGRPKYTFVQNPEWDVFREVGLRELKEGVKVVGEGVDEALQWNLPFEPQKKRINVTCNSVDALEFETWRARLMEAGASDVRRKVTLGQGIFGATGEKRGATEEAGEEGLEAEAAKRKEEEEETLRAPTTATFIEALPAFIDTIPQDLNLIPADKRSEYIAVAERLMKQADADTAAGLTGPNTTAHVSTTSSLPVFHGTLKTLMIQNFFSIQGSLTIPFEKLAPGIWFLTGPNGSGKSTILEAIVWCLFGQVLRSDMAAADPINDVVRRNCCVRIDFENGYSVERFRNFPSKGGGSGPGLRLYKDGKEVEGFERGEMRKTQMALERDVIGCDFGTFTKSVIFGDQGAGAGNFLTLDSKQRREVLDELLGIGRFEGYMKAVRDEKRVLEKDYIGLKARSEVVSAEIRNLKWESERLESGIGPKEEMRRKAEDELGRLEEEVKRFEVDRERVEREQGRILEWNKVYDALLRLHDDRGRFEEQIVTREMAVEEARRALKKAEEARPVYATWAAAQKEIDRANRQVQMKDMELRQASSQIRELERKLERFVKEADRGVCPTCQQSLSDTQHVEKHIARYKKQKEEAEKNMEKLGEERDEIKRELLAQEEKQKDVLKTMEQRDLTLGYLSGLPEREREAKRAIYVNETPLGSLRDDLKRAEKSLEKMLNGRTMEEVAVLANRQDDEAVSSLQKAMQNHKELLRRIQTLSARRTTLTSSLTKLATEVSFATTQVKTMREKMGALEKEMEGSRERLERLEGDIRVLLFWDTAFSKKQATVNAPNMRHFLISSSIEELNSLIKTNMSLLTTPILSPAPAVTTTNTLGLQRRLDAELPISFTPDLSIYPPSAFGKRSSGQRKRNNLAVLFALFQLIRQKSRFRADFIMLDEVFDALDREGQVQAAELISAVSAAGTSRIGAAGGEVKHVLVVTHSESLEDVVKVGSGGAGARMMKVENGERGTRMSDPEGVVVHTWGVTDGEQGVPDVETSLESNVGRRVGAVEEEMETGVMEEVKEEVKPVKKTKRVARKKTESEQEVTASEADGSMEAVAETPKTRKRASKKKASDPALQDIEPSTENAEAAIPEKKTRKRTPRKKATEPLDESEAEGKAEMEVKPKKKRSSKKAVVDPENVETVLQELEEEFEEEELQALARGE
ncbi:hypothetical protein BDZ91DRAFT_745687 [Kalaharituber pfeilii]|nr:hypothetical protein BDZ91DRAFT_745687 [Kalaharituber pfeilii]